MREVLLFILLVLVLFGIVMLFFVYMPYESIKANCERIIKEVEERDLGLEVRFYDKGWNGNYECQVKVNIDGRESYISYFLYKNTISSMLP
jgi:hypothetical protein